MNGFMRVQAVVAIMLVRQPRLRFAYYGLMAVLALASVVTWQGVPSFLAAAVTTLSTIGRMQINDVILRVLMRAATPFWAVHDLIVGSFPGLIADVSEYGDCRENVAVALAVRGQKRSPPSTFQVRPVVMRCASRTLRDAIASKIYD
jgi:hypothetical protein